MEAQNYMQFGFYCRQDNMNKLIDFVVAIVSFNEF